MKKPFLFLWLVIGAAVLFSWIYLPTLSHYQDLKTRQDGIEIQTRNLEAKLKDIKEERDLLKNDPGYLEKVIREELGLVKPGEIVYKFVEEKPAPKLPPEADPPVTLKEAAAKVPAPPAVGLTVPAKKIPAPAPAPVAAKAVLPAVPKAVTGSSSAEPAYPRRETR